MYDIVFTKGNEEKVITQRETLEEAKAECKSLSKKPEYCDGVITIEKDGRIY